MPVDPDMQFTWPVCSASFTTPNDAPVVVVISEATAVGAVSLIPELQIIGRTLAGVDGNARFGVYSVMRSAGSTVLRTHFEDDQVFGVGGLGIAVSIVANEFVATLTGLPAADVKWNLFWREIQGL